MWRDILIGREKFVNFNVVLNYNISVVRVSTLESRKNIHTDILNLNLI